jgi:hypothetical protein
VSLSTAIARIEREVRVWLDTRFIPRGVVAESREKASRQENDLPAISVDP